MARWFRRKSFGLGWTPCTWQGWLVVLGFVALALAVDLGMFGMTADQRTGVILALIVPFIALTVFTSGKNSDA
jgi:hypothetical protein